MSPRIWVLLGQRRGDNNQLLALAEGLKLPFETRTLGYRSRWSWILKLFPDGIFHLAGGKPEPPWPDLVIGIGRRSVSVARWIQRRNPRAILVRLGNPRADPTLFDLVITTPQYPVPAAPNVLTLPVAMGRGRQIVAKIEEKAWLHALPRPHLLLSLGGTTRYWSFPVDAVANAAATLAGRDGTLLVAPSPRTPTEALAAIRSKLGKRSDWHIVTDEIVRYPVLLADADEHFVTADSVSMLSEAVLTGKPVGLIPVDLDEEGQRELGDDLSADIRDVRRFWVELEERGLVGTVEAPACGSVEDPVALAVAAVRRLLGDRVEQPPATPAVD